MIAEKPKMLAQIATLKPILAERLALLDLEYKSITCLPPGLIGKIISIYDNGENAYYLIEFTNSKGHEYAMVALSHDEFVVLQYEVNY